MVDCGLLEVLEISEDGTYDTIKTGLPNFYLAAREKKIQESMDRLKNIGAYDNVYKDLK
jgi:hypothetical protein